MLPVEGGGRHDHPLDVVRQAGRPQAGGGAEVLEALLGRTCHARVVEEADGVQPQVRARPDLAQQELRAVAPAHDQHALRGKRPARQVTHDAPRGEDRGDVQREEQRGLTQDRSFRRDQLEIGPHAEGPDQHGVEHLGHIVESGVAKTLAVALIQAVQAEQGEQGGHVRESPEHLARGTTIGVRERERGDRAQPEHRGVGGDEETAREGRPGREPARHRSGDARGQGPRVRDVDGGRDVRRRLQVA